MENDRTLTAIASALLHHMIFNAKNLILQFLLQNRYDLSFVKSFIFTFISRPPRLSRALQFYFSITFPVHLSTTSASSADLDRYRPVTAEKRHLRQTQKPLAGDV